MRHAHLLFIMLDKKIKPDRSKRRYAWARWDMQHTILSSGAVLMIILVAYPMLQLVIKSLPLSNYVSELSATQTLLAFSNTLYVAVGTTLLGCSFGVTLAFFVTRTDMVLRRLVNACVYLIFLTPGYIGTIAWIQLLGRGGYISRWTNKQFGLLRPPVDIYTLEGVIVVMSLYLMPLIYMATVNALEKADPGLEEAAVVSGATPRRAVFTVTLPLALPGMLAGVLLVFIHGLSSFGVPAALGMPAGNMVLTTLIYSALGHYDVRKACAVAVVLALMLIAVMALHNRALKRNRYAVEASSNLKKHELKLGIWRYITGGFFLFVMGIVALLPLLTILLTSLLKAWGLPIIMKNLSLGNYLSIFTVGVGARAIRNSFLYSIAAAMIATMLGFVIAYISIRTKLPGRKILDFLATSPSAIPGPVLAAAMIFAWMLPPVKLYNTPWIILVAYITAFLPYAVRNIAGGLKSMKPNQEEMGWMCGGSWLAVLRDVVLPGLRGSMWTSWMLVFLMAFREIPLSTMLYTDGTETVGVLLFMLKTEAGGLEVTSAVSVIVILLTTLGQLFIRQITNNSSKVVAQDGKNG